MRKYVVILLVFILLFTSSCSNKEKEEHNLPTNNIDNIDEDIKDTNDITDIDSQDTSNENNTDNNDEKNTATENTDETNLKAANIGISIDDGDYIYYVPMPYDNLYRIKKDGSEKTLIHEQERIFNIQIYDNRLYAFSSIYTDTIPLLDVIPSKIVSMNKDGSDIKLLDFDLEFTTLYHLSGFWIYNDLMFFTVRDYMSDIMSMNIPNDLYKYDLINGKIINIHKSLDGGDIPIIYGDFCYYIIDENGEHTLYKFNIYTDEKDSITINKHKNLDQINYIYSDFQIEDDYIYYHSKTYIDRDKLDGSSDTETIFENEEFIIVSIAITDEYIFFINMEEQSQENIDDDTMNLTIRRIKRDGSELKTIFTETMRSTNLAPSSVRVMFEDNTLIYRNRISDTFRTMDFDGVILNRD